MASADNWSVMMSRILGRFPSDTVPKGKAFPSIFGPMRDAPATAPAARMNFLRSMIISSFFT